MENEEQFFTQSFIIFLLIYFRLLRLLLFVAAAN